MNLPAGFGRIDFSEWARGLVSAVVSGGAGAVACAFAVALQDPSHYAVGGKASLELMLMCFVVNGFLSGMNFLRSKPIPDLKQVVTTVQTLKPSGVIVTTREETSLEPITPAVPPK